MPDVIFLVDIEIWLISPHGTPYAFLFAFLTVGDSTDIGTVL